VVDSIPPKGMTVTEYPPFVKTAEVARLADLSKAIADMKQSLASTRKTIDAEFNPDEMFFLAHYGMTPFETLIKRHFFSADGKRVKMTTTNIRSLATEILAYRNPAPSANLKQANLIIMLSACNKFLDDQDKLRKLEAELVTVGFDSLVRMTSPPIPPYQIMSVTGAGMLRSAHVKSSSPYAWKSSFRTIHKDLAKSFKLKPAVTIETHMKKMGFRFDKRIGDFVHSKGYALTPFLIYHVKSILDNPSPVGYWSHVAKYRLAAIKVAERLSEVHLVEVNPNTGAAFNKGVVVGVYADEPSNALAYVRGMYPHVLELKSNVNPTLDATISISDQTSGLKESAERWALTGSKQSRKVVNVIRTTWDWADLDLSKNQSWYAAFASRNKPNRGQRTFAQQQLLDFQSDDSAKAKVAIKAGNPPAEVSHLLYGGNPMQMQNCFPTSKSEFYLLPAGTEEAFERICNPVQGNVVVKYVNSVLSGKDITGQKHPKITVMDNIKFANALKDINHDMEILRAAICSPYLYTLGYEKLLLGSSMENLGLRSTLAQRMRVRKIFEMAKWPKQAGELVFKAPVNDPEDVQAMRGKFEAAMKQTGSEAPSELSFFEMPELKLLYTPMIHEGGQAINYGIVRGSGYPFTSKNNSSDQKLFRYYDAGKTNANWKTLYIYRDLTFASGIRSKSSDPSVSKDAVFTSMTTLEEVKPVSIQSPGPNYGEVAAVTTGLTGTALVVGLYLASKRGLRGGNS
jgi:hypothetical protein